MRIGILLGMDVEQSAIAPLKFLILRLNTLQTHFEYEFLPTPEAEDDFLSMLGSGELVNRKDHKKTIAGFLRSYRQYLTGENGRYKLTEELPSTHW